MAQMLSPNPGRISQNLPIPKCSTCSQFVPLEELGDHICALPPPLPKSVATSAAVAALLPKRLQGRTPSPGRMGSPSPSTSRSASHSSVSGDTPLSVNITRLPQGNNLRARTPSNTAQPISTTVRETPTAACPSPSRETPTTPRPKLYPQSPDPPLRNTPPGQPSQLPAQNRSGTPLGYRGPPRGLSTSPSGAPASRFPGNTIPPRDMSSPSPQNIFPGTIGPGAVIPEAQQSFVPAPERGIDTKTGGEAGMAGVGRRGFAAVARAAMFALPSDKISGPRPNRRSSQQKYLNIDALSRRASFLIDCLMLATEILLLYPGSGYSSHSPEPMSPLPQSEAATQPIATRTPSDQPLSTPIPPESLRIATSDAIAAKSPLTTRFPFFEKLKNKVPGDSTNTASNDSSLDSSFPTSISIVRKKTLDSIDSVSLYRSTTSSSTSSRPLKDVRRPISPLDSESEYGGLAYADSTDNEGNDGKLSRSQSKNSSHSGMPALILRTGSSSSARRHRHPSGSEQSENSNDRLPILIGSTIPRAGHSRTPSASSISGDDGPFTRGRANSAVIAQALGLSQTPPSDYGKMGGPGVMGGRRRDSSISRRNAGPDSLEEMEKALEEAKIKARSKQPSFGSSSQRSHLYRADTTSSIASSRKDDDVIGNGGDGVKARRSNTIHSPRPTSPVKLPMRALTSPKFDRDKALDGTGVRKERVRKAKVCMKCQKVIDNGRWVSVDGGGVLCERCWKNMYLPKVSFFLYACRSN